MNTNSTDTPVVHAPEIQAKLDCLHRANAALCATVAELEETFGSADTLLIAAGVVRSVSSIHRMMARIAREAAQ